MNVLLLIDKAYSDNVAKYFVEKSLFVLKENGKSSNFLQRSEKDVLS